MSTFKNILENLKKKYQQKYGIAVFDIGIKNTASGIEIKGKVLTGNQRSEVLKEFRRDKIKIKKEDIKILSDMKKRNEIGWAVVKNKIIDLKSRFVSDKIINEKILNRIRCSQAFDKEILRVLCECENQLLVQQSDLTLGWVNKSEVIMKKKGLYEKWIHQFHTLGYGIKNKILIVKADKNNIIKEAEKYLGVKYVLGGKSEKGIDCSGLVQLAYKNSLGVILPKHSWDQKEMGVKVKLEDVETGDLIFLVKKSNKHKHVGIVEIVLVENAERLHSSDAETMEPAINLIHASLNKKKVVRQKLEEVFESYDFVEARRVVK